MSLATVAATVAPSISPSPSPGPSISPVVHAVTQATTVAAPSIFSGLNTIAAQLSTADLVVAAGVLATALQSQLNKLPWLQHDVARIQDARRFLVSVAIPGATFGLSGLATGQNNLHLGAFAFAVAQFTFYVVKLLKGAPAPASLATDATPAG